MHCYTIVADGAGGIFIIFSVVRWYSRSAGLLIFCDTTRWRVLPAMQNTAGGGLFIKRAGK